MHVDANADADIDADAGYSNSSSALKCRRAKNDKSIMCHYFETWFNTILICYRCKHSTNRCKFWEQLSLFQQEICSARVHVPNSSIKGPQIFSIKPTRALFCLMPSTICSNCFRNWSLDDGLDIALHRKGKHHSVVKCR